MHAPSPRRAHDPYLVRPLPIPKRNAPMNVSPRLVASWKAVLQLSNVRDTESAVLLLGEESHPAHVAAARYALAVLGTRALSLQLGEPPARGVAGESTAYYGPTALSGNQPAI